MTQKKISKASPTREALLDRRATEWFRGLAVILVVASHYGEWWAWFTPSEGNAELFRLGLTKLGGYGVSMFFLFSGYGLVKSLKGNRTDLFFVWKRIRSVYLPYFIIVGFLELLSGGFTSVGDFLYFATGYDYWYMLILFCFYLAFMLLWALPLPKPARILALAAFTLFGSSALFLRQMNDFWYTSNTAFVLGVLCGEYEPYVKKLIDHTWWLLLILLSAVMVLVVRSGLGLSTPPAVPFSDAVRAWQSVGAEASWALLTLVLAARWRWTDPFFRMLGRDSLYIYLTHTYIFMRCVNSLSCGYALRFIVSAALTIAASALCGLILPRLFRLLDPKTPAAAPKNRG